MPDCDRFRLRSFLDELMAADELLRITEPVDLIEVGAYLEGNPRAVLFERVGPEEAGLVGNVMGSRPRLAMALGVEPHQVMHEVARRAAAPIRPVRVRSHEAPVHDVVLRHDEIDLTRLPIHVQHAGDGAPFISAALDFSAKQTPGAFNVGCRRLMLRGPRETGVDLNSPSDLRAQLEAARADGRRLPVAFAIGSHPCDYVAATLFSGAEDELALLGGLRGAALPVVAAVSQDGLVVPADAELVLEGYIDGGEMRREGPYGEFLGYLGATKLNPVFHVTAVTHRRDALFQTATISGRDLARTDTAQLVALATEVNIWNVLRGAVRKPVAVYAPPASGGMYNVRIALRQQYPGEARNAIAAAFGSKADVKNVFVVDDDIDIMSDSQMEWALATRFQAARDSVIGTGFRAVPIDPSLAGQRTGDKAGFDLTRPFGEAAIARWQVAMAPPTTTNGRGNASGVVDALQDGPLTYLELMTACGSRDGRDIARDLISASAAGAVILREDGRYARG
jgi:2,5-furandicarboxylate decarboxylase 1